jgi:hypothetical protein
MPTITICSSANFYKQVVDIRERLEKLGFKVLIPKMAEKMRETGIYDVSHYKTWHDDKDYSKKTPLIRGHFDEVAKADAILVMNYEKHGVDNYIGGNVLMEMALAFYLNLPIFILNEIPSESSFLEEIHALAPIVLHGELKDLKAKYKRLDSPG